LSPFLHLLNGDKNFQLDDYENPKWIHEHKVLTILQAVLEFLEELIVKGIKSQSKNR
jgi:hypothetical protein